MAGFDPVNFHQLTQEQQDNVRGNILNVERLLEDLVQLATEHISATHGECIKSCLGVDVTTYMDGCSPRLWYMVLTLALRELAQQRYDKGPG